MGPVATDAPGPSVFANSAANLTGLVAGNALGALAGFLTAKQLHAEGVGILAVSFGLAEFGRALSNFTHNPSILVYHRGESAERVFGTSLALKFLGTALFAALVAMLAPPLATFFRVPAWAIVLTSLGLFAGIFQEIGAARFEAEDKMVMRNVLVALGPTVALVAILVLIAAGRFTLATSILASILGTLGMSIGFAVYWRGPWRLRIDRAIGRYYVSYGSRIVLATFLTSSLVWTDTLLISHLQDNEAAGVYQVAFQLTFVMVTASVAIGVALVPALSRLARKGSSTALAYQRGTLIALGLAVLVALAYVLLGRFILRLYGPEFEAGYPALLILTLFGIMGALAVPAQSVLTVLDRAGLLIGVGLVQVALNLPLNWFLIQAWGITGAAVSTTIAFSVGTLALWWLVKRETGAWPLSREVVAEGWLAVRTGLTRGRELLRSGRARR